MPDEQDDERPEPTDTEALRALAAETGSHDRLPGAPTTEAIQTVQRIMWTRIILATVGAVFGLIILGWVAGAIAQTYATPAEVRAYEQLQNDPDATTISASQDDVSASVLWREGEPETVLRVTGLPDLRTGEQFVAWYVVDDTPIEAQAFQPASEDATLFLEAARPDGAGLEITIEPEGSVDIPTGDVIVSIPPSQ